MKKKYILAFDQGTTSSRAILFDREGIIVSMAQEEFTQIYPQTGRVEHDPFEIWQSQIRTAKGALAKAQILKEEIAALGITNQRETTLVWKRSNGTPVCNAIVWQDRRTAAFCDQIRLSHGDLIRQRTGLETDAYFSASKINWILNNIDNARSMADAGELCFGTIDTWLVWKLTGGRTHVTDVSNASRTMLFDIAKLEWDQELLDLFEIPNSILPEVKSSSEVYGEISAVRELDGIPISGIAGDQQAALFGQQCFETGETKNTYGTGCFMLQNTGTKPISSKNKLLTTIAWGLDGETYYALEGSVFIGGAVIQWLRDELGIIATSAAVENLANSVDGSGGVYFVPAFAGLGTPYWDQNARGAILGLTRGTGKAHIARAAVESIAFQTAELLEAVQKDSAQTFSELRVDGGATSNDSLLQFQADLLGIPVIVAETVETTARGAAYLAGLGVGIWRNTDELKNNGGGGKRFEPLMERDEAAKKLQIWRKAVARSLNWAVD